jgi:LDH2 family malate/lactate/ureidoglycolate dehydrogenase
VIEGHNGIGQIALHRAVQFALENVQKYGTVTVAGRNVSWLGALGIYLIPLAERGFLAQLWAQTANCRDCAPWGGIDARFSTNPVALAFPTGGDPVIADFSTAAMSVGKASQLQRAGRKAPERVFLDKQGRLTDDPNVMRDGGTMLFLGGEHFGYKGYALSLWCEAMTALAGGHCNNPDSPQRQSFCLTAVMPEAFAGRGHYDEEMRRFIAHVRSSRLREGFDAIRLPGERGYRALREARQRGVPVDDARLAQLQSLAGKLGVPWSLPVPC